MSYKLLNLKHGYFPVPQALMEGDNYAKLAPSECKLLHFLYAAMNRHSSPCIRISGTQLKMDLGMGDKTIRAARRGLESKGHIRCDRADEFQLLNPETGAPFPPEAGRTPIAEYKPRKTKPQGRAEKCMKPDSNGALARAEICVSAMPAECPQDGNSLLTKQKGKDDRTCPIHSKARIYYDGDWKWHCKECEPSPYLPPEDTLPIKAADRAEQRTWEELYGRR